MKYSEFLQEPNKIVLLNVKAIDLIDYNNSLAKSLLDPKKQAERRVKEKLKSLLK